MTVGGEGVTNQEWLPCEKWVECIYFVRCTRVVGVRANSFPEIEVSVRK